MYKDFYKHLSIKIFVLKIEKFLKICLLRKLKIRILNCTLLTFDSYYIDFISI